MSTTEASDALLQALQQQFEILRTAHFTNLPKALDAVSRSLGRLEGQQLDQETADQISALATRNAKIARAALNGVQTARARLALHRDPEKDFRTYSRSGRSARIRADRGSKGLNY